MTQIQKETELNNKPSVLIPLTEEVTEEKLKQLIEQYPSRAWKGMEQGILKKQIKQIWFYPEIDHYSQVIIMPVKMSELEKSRKQTLDTIVNPQLINKNSFVVDLSGIEELLSEEQITLLIRNISAGVIIGKDRMNLFKTDDRSENGTAHILFNSSRKSILKSSMDQGIAYGETVNSIRRLVNLPSNKKSPLEMAEWLIQSSEKYGYTIEIKEKTDLEKEGFHALLAVNRGSEIPAKCLIAEYKARGKDDLIKIVLVGKGVTFDTGGLSIKGSQNMHYMKSDMGGAAAVMGTIEMIAKLELPVHLIAVVPTTDNSVDSRSIKPGDVIDSYSGKTIEVIDTDAEGRLILADALSYSIQEYNPDYIIDLATLTGSVVRALGTEAAGYFTNNDKLAAGLEKASSLAGEKIWRLPLWDEYNEYLKSDIADIRNLGTKPMAGAITAGKFLETFTHGHTAWGHIDIAGTAFGNYPGSTGYAATGYGVLLLTEWIKSIITNE